MRKKLEWFIIMSITLTFWGCSNAQTMPDLAGRYRLIYYPPNTGVGWPGESNANFIYVDNILLMIIGTELAEIIGMDELQIVTSGEGGWEYKSLESFYIPFENIEGGIEQPYAQINMDAMPVFEIMFFMPWGKFGAKTAAYRADSL